MGKIVEAIREAHCFNPHPSRRTGATLWWRSSKQCCIRFNPHPSRRTGATLVLALDWQ